MAIADDSEGVAINPASSALRLPYSWNQWDYGLGIDIAVGAWLPKNDWYNQGGAEGAGESTALFGSVAAVLYHEHAGLGVSAEAQSNAASRQDRIQGIDSDFGANFGIVHASLAHGFLDGQLLLGVGPRLVGMSFDRHGSGSGPLSTAGVGYELGAVYKPQVGQYRLAAAFKSPIDARLSDDTTGFERFHVPWQLALGAAYQFGARPLNPPFVTAKKFARRSRSSGEPSKAEIERAREQLFERYQRLQHRYLLVSAELSIIEGDADHLGIERLWTEPDDASASRPILSPRIGLESELIKQRLRLRVGSYYEAERIDLAPARVHGTGGFDLGLFDWNVFGLVDRFDRWQLSVAADAARAYLSTSFSVGFWH